MWHKRLSVISLLLPIILFLLTIHYSFFWDTVQLASKHASYYFGSGFSSLLLPDNLDSGHIPAFGIYLAGVWKLFGRTLLVSHFAMLPFAIGIVWQVQRLIKYYFDGTNVGWAALLILLDPTLLAQITLVSPDIVLVFFFLVAWNSIIRNKRLVLSLAILGLFLISMRGMMVAFVLLIVDLYYNIPFKQDRKEVFNNLLKRSTIYLPALFLFIIYSIYHYSTKSWVGFHLSSPWADSFAAVGITGVIKNIGILAWRIIDFGRIGLWLIFGILYFKYHKHIFKDQHTRDLAFVFLCFLIILPLNMIWAEGLLAHRYLMPIYLCFAILVAKVLFSPYVIGRLRSILLILWIAFLTTGHLWVYPPKISQGWDSSLAYLPYNKLRHQAIQYLDNENINFDQVSSFFPNANTLDDIDLNGDMRSFTKFTPGAEYVFYSNVNNVSDEVYTSLLEDYDLVKEYREWRVYVHIYKIKSD